MEDQPSSVILIFREREKRWRDEHPINIAAAVMTNSKFHHVEIAIGDESGNRGEMRNVVRIFNDAVRSIYFHVPYPPRCHGRLSSNAHVGRGGAVPANWSLTNVPIFANWMFTTGRT